MDAPHPARQMTSIGKAGLCGDLGKAAVPNHFDRPSLSQMNDMAMRAHPDGASESAGKMEKWNWLRWVIFASVATSSGSQPQRRQIGCASSVPPHRTTATGEARCVMGGERAGPPAINLSKLAANFRSGFDAVTPS